jgi:hypothetical protein
LDEWAFWITPPHEHRIYGDDQLNQWAVVDDHDYSWAVTWRWCINKPHPRRNGKKLYLYRNQSNGRRYAPTLYLHVEIMKRTGVEPPSPLHRLVDHRDGNSLNCRRSNLRWATPVMNRANINGCCAHEQLVV